MLITIRRWLSCFLPVVLTPSTGAGDESVNIQLAIAFYQEIIRNRSRDAVDRLIAEGYIQHSANVQDGREGVLLALDSLSELPKPAEPSPSPIIRAIAENDLVVLHLNVSMPGIRLAVLDLFRVEDHRLAEHWEAIEPIPEGDETRMTGGTTAIAPQAATARSRAVVLTLYETVWLERDLARFDEIVAEDLLQHDARIAPGRAGLRAALEDLDGFQPTKVHRSIAQGDFVVVQLEGGVGSDAFVAYDICRVENERIVEMWRVRQQVPEEMPHANGML